MSIKLGSTSIGSLYLGSTKIGAAYLGGTKIYASSVVDPLNPLGLPAYTVRVKLEPGYTPGSQSGVAHTLVDATENIWDYYKNSRSFALLFHSQIRLLEVLGANTSGVTDMAYMFYGCSALTTVPLFDTSSVTGTDDFFAEESGMAYMFSNCSSLTAVPLFDTSSVIAMNNMFYNCTSVASGALALYQQASTQTTPPSYHTGTFYNCGSNTQTGAAELAQIPSSWGGDL